AEPVWRLANRARDRAVGQPPDPGTHPHGKLLRQRGTGWKTDRPAGGMSLGGQGCHAGPAARTVAATSPRHSVGTTKELSSNFSSSLIKSGKRRGSTATAKTSWTPLVNLSRATG